jgi:hypothetical protein
MTHRRFDVGREPVKLDRSLHQAPDAAKGDQDEHSGKGADPTEHMMRAAADMPRRSPVQPKAGTRRFRFRSLAILTRIGNPTRLAAFSQIIR